MSEIRLTRSRNDRIIAGVAGGLANYLNIDPVFVRLAFVILLFASGIALPIYLVLWLVMPDESSESGTESEVIQKNISEISETVSSGVNKFGRPGTVGIVLVLLGIYFLFSQLGILDGTSGFVFWPLAIIAVGIYMLVRRNR